jgi:hypothetical protein
MKDVLFIVGVVFILLACWPESKDAWSERSGSNPVFEYSVLILWWACVVNVLDWRRALTDLGVPQAASWVLAPIGVIVMTGLTIVAIIIEDDVALWKWIAALLVWIAGLVGYLVVLNAP